MKENCLNCVKPHVPSLVLCEIIYTQKCFDTIHSYGIDWKMQHLLIIVHRKY